MIRPPIRAGANRYLTRELDRLPEYASALQLCEKAQRKLDELAPVADVPTGLDPIATGDISDEWIDARLRRDESAREVDQRRRILVDLRRRAEDHASGVLHANLDAILTGLHQELSAIMDAVKAAADQLAGAATADEAIAADAGPEWKRLKELADDYAELRAGQELVMIRYAPSHVERAQSSERDDDHASDLYLANLDALWPDWRTPHRALWHADGRRPRVEPWPEEETARLLWLTTSEAQPWIPTTAQLVQLWEQRQRRASPSPAVIKAGRTLNRIATPMNNVPRSEETAYV